MPPSAAASSSDSALVPRSSSSTLARSTLRQKVLSEETYTSTLSSLIRRDFFPHLERLEAENAYLDALTHADEPGGEDRLERAVRRLVGHEVRAGIVPPTPRPGDTVRSRRREETPTLTPITVYFDETPRASAQNRGEWDPTPLPHQEAVDTNASINEAEDDIDEGPPLDGLTLSSFQSQYTSEDNASFLDILKANEVKRKEVYKWAYDAERKAKEKRQKSLMASQLQAKAGFQSSLEQAPLDVKRQIESGKQPRMITANGETGQVEPVEGEKEKLPMVGMAEISPATEDARSLQTWPYRARNALFYGPDANRSTVSQRTSSLPLYRKSGTQGPKSIFDEDVPLDRAPGINFNNTRLPDEDDEIEGSRGSETPRSSRINAAIGGWGETLSIADTSNETDVASQLEISSSPQVAGYSFVSPLPSPRPGDLGEERVRQLMTWGTVVGTPRAIGQSVGTAGDLEDQYDGSFRIPPTPSRDLLARRLTDKTSGNRKRPSAATTLKTSSKRRSSVDLSPAARSLFDRTSRGSTGFSSLGNSLLASRDRRQGSSSSSSNRLGRERWTPSPSPRR